MNTSLGRHKGLALAAVGALTVARQGVPTLMEKLPTAGHLVVQLLPVVARVGHIVPVAAKVVVTHAALLRHSNSLLFQPVFDYEHSHHVMHRLNTRQVSIPYQDS